MPRPTNITFTNLPFPSSFSTTSSSSLKGWKRCCWSSQSMIDVAVWSCVITHISTGQSPAQLRLRSSHAHKSYLPTHAHHHHHHLFFPTHGYKILFVWYSFLMIRFRFESKLRMNGKNTLWIYSIKLKPSSTWLTSNKCEEGVPLLWT